TVRGLLETRRVVASAGRRACHGGAVREALNRAADLRLEGHAEGKTTFTAWSSFEGSEPPAWAKSGRPPPPPPTMAAASRTTSPALCSPVISFETEHARSAFPLLSEPRRTTAGASRSRS